MRFVVGSIFVIGIAALLPAGLRAQQTSARPELDLAITYTAQRGTVSGGGSFWTQGGSAELSTTVYHGFGLAANIAGTHTSDISSSGVGLTMITAAFGPRYTWSHPLLPESKKRFSLFGQTLIGTAHATDSVFPSTAGAQNKADAFALQLGGGMDLTLTRHLAIRPMQADWLRTQFPNGGSNVQNNLRLATGLVLRFR